MACPAFYVLFCFPHGLCHLYLQQRNTLTDLPQQVLMTVRSEQKWQRRPETRRC